MRPVQPKVVLTCAITGNLTRPTDTPHLPITPEQTVESALGAADAGASVVHIHVRDPMTGSPSMALDHYAAVCDGLRQHRPDLIVNLTTGPGGRFVPSADDPRLAGPGTTLLPPADRVAHIAALKPDIATLDLNTMWSGTQVVINAPSSVRAMAKTIYGAGTVPEIELFDSGDAYLLHDLLRDGCVTGPVRCCLIFGVKYGWQPTSETLAYACRLLPPDAIFTLLGTGRMMFPLVAQSYLAGGHVRVGLEDGIYLSRGQLAQSNRELVVKARRIVEDLGGELATTSESCAILGLGSREEHAA